MPIGLGSTFSRDLAPEPRSEARSLVIQSLVLDASRVPRSESPFPLARASSTYTLVQRIFSLVSFDSVCAPVRRMAKALGLNLETGSPSAISGCATHSR